MAQGLTVKAVDAARPDPSKRLEISDGLLPALRLVVQPSGAKSWAVRYRVADRPKKLTLGGYPGLTLAAAREAARKALRDLAVGEDPGAAKLAAREAEREAEVAARAAEAAQLAAQRDTVAALFEQYDKRHLRTIKSGAAARRFLERFMLPAWGERDARSITKRDLLNLLDGIVDRGTAITANRVLAHVRAFLNWLVARDVLDRNPAAGVRPPVKERTRERVLTDGEVGWFWTATAVEGAPFGPLARVLLLTGQRLGEVGGMT